MRKTGKRCRSTEEVDGNVEVDDQVTNSVDEIQLTLLNTATELLNDFIKKRRSCATKANAQQKQMYNVQEVKKASDYAEKFIEDDNVQIANCSLSIATTIKRACLQKYDNYKNLNDNDKMIVALGANGILDLSKKNSPHKDLLGSNVFSVLQERYPPSLSHINIFEDIVNVGDIEQKAKIDLNQARALANKKESASKGLESTVYDTYSEYLKILQFKKVLRTDLDSTEGDFVVKVWGPLLESTMRDEEELRLMWVESVEGLSGAHESREFKVDVRAAYDRYSSGTDVKEENTVKSDRAKADVSISKITSDRIKLFIENKCVIDRLLFEGISKENAIVPCLQIKGPRAILYSMRLVASGLYVGVEEGRCSLTKNGSDISNFRHAVNLLQTFKRSLLNLVSVNIQGDNGFIHRKESIKERRSTWNPPNKNSKIPHLPQYLLK